MKDSRAKAVKVRPDHSIRPGEQVEIEDYFGAWHPCVATSPVQPSSGRAERQRGQCHVIVRNDATGDEYGWPAEYVRRARRADVPR